MIKNVHARQILDSRGNPTIEVEVTLGDNSMGRSAVPSGASTGVREALELRDKESTQYLGRSVHTAIKNVIEIIKPTLIGKTFTQKELDQTLIDLDGTENKSKLGANAILGVSMAFAVAESISREEPLYAYIGQLIQNRMFTLPRPMFNIMNGGAHADWTTDIQEYMIISQEDSYPEQLRKSVEVFHHLGNLLKEKGLSAHVGNEGGYAPAINSNDEAFELILAGIERAGYTTGKDGDFLLAVDIAASEFYADGFYNLRRDNKKLTSEEMITWVENLAQRYPLTSIEDPLAESDWDAWKLLTEKLDETHQIVGDDLLVTNTKYIERAIAEKSCNSVLIKLNQIGTVTETLDAISMTQSTGFTVVPSHRSGETEDVFLTHLAVGVNAGQIKTGAPSRTDRTAKYNELTRIEEDLHSAL